MQGRRGSLLLLLAVIKSCFQTQNFIARSQAQVSPYTSLHWRQVQVPSRIYHCFPDAQYFSWSSRSSNFCNHKRLSFHLQETKWKQSPEKSYICGSEVGKICSVYPKTEGKWKQQKCIFFLWFIYSHPERHFQIAQEPYGRAKEGIQVLITPHFTLTRNR